MSGWKFEYQLRDNSLRYTGRTTMDNDRPLAERVARLEAALAQLTARYERPKETSMDDDDCGAISPDMADPCRNERGHLGAHWALCGEMWERTEPEGLGKMNQNCTLTADDPEPPIGSVVLDSNKIAWQRYLNGWRTNGSIVGWFDLFESDDDSVTLLYRGEA